MKVWTYIIIFTTMMVILEFMGFPTGIGGVLNQFGVQISNESGEVLTNMASSSMWNKIFAAGGILILVGGIGGVIAGLFGKQFDVNVALLPFITGVLVLFATTAGTLINYVNELHQTWATALIATIFVPLGIGYIVAMVEFFRGSD